MSNYYELKINMIDHDELPDKVIDIADELAGLKHKRNSELVLIHAPMRESIYSLIDSIPMIADGIVTEWATDYDQFETVTVFVSYRGKNWAVAEYRAADCQMTEEEITQIRECVLPTTDYEAIDDTDKCIAELEALIKEEIDPI